MRKLIRAKTEEKSTSELIENHWGKLIIAFAIFQCCINVLACLLYILDDYVSTKWIGYMELAISGYFCIEIGFNFYFYEGRKYNFFLSIDTWIDLLTVLPEIIPLFLQSGNNNSVSFLRILRVFKIMRVIKFRKTLKKMSLSKREKELELNVESISRLSRQLIFLVISLFAALFISAGIITFVQDVFNESMNEKLKFFDSFYFVVITATTIGYGDIYIR